MEILECLQAKSHLASLLQSVLIPLDSAYYLAYLVLLLFRLDTIRVIICLLFVSALYELMLATGVLIKYPYQFFILASIACSYVTMYYHNQNNRVSIGLAVMSLFMFTMANEVLLNAMFGEWFYNALYNSYEILVSFIHGLIIALFIHWRKVFNTVVKLIGDTRSGQNSVNSLFVIL